MVNAVFSTSTISSAQRIAKDVADIATSRRTHQRVADFFCAIGNDTIEIYECGIKVFASIFYVCLCVYAVCEFFYELWQAEGQDWAIAQLEPTTKAVKAAVEWWNARGKYIALSFGCVVWLLVEELGRFAWAFAGRVVGDKSSALAPQR